MSSRLDKMVEGIRSEVLDTMRSWGNLNATTPDQSQWKRDRDEALDDWVSELVTKIMARVNTAISEAFLATGEK